MLTRTQFLLAFLILAFIGPAGLYSDSASDGDLTARQRLFPSIGPGLRAIKLGPNGKYYVLASPNVGVAIFDGQGKQLSVIGGPPPVQVANKIGRSAIAFAEDCDPDDKGNVYVADRGYNLINLFSPDGKLLRSIPINSPVSVAALPDGEVATTSLHAPPLVSIYGPSGKVVREFGELTSLSSREDINRYLSLGRVLSDAKGHLYYAFTYLPEPLVRRYDRFGFAGQEFEFTGLDAFPEARAARKEIERQEKNEDVPPIFRPTLTALGVDPVSGDIWMALHNTLLHFDRDGNRLSEYQIYTKEGARLEAVTILVEPDRLLIGSDPLGIYEFERPDRKR